jgi:hypothetical protein
VSTSYCFDFALGMKAGRFKAGLRSLWFPLYFT